MKTQRIESSQALRYRKPLVSGLSWRDIIESFWEMLEVIGAVQYMRDDDAELLDAFDGDEEQVFEFKLAYSDLMASCDSMLEEIDEFERQDENVEDLFNCFFPAINADGQYYGYDRVESDYFSLTQWQTDSAREYSREKLKRLTKDQILDLAGMCLGIVRNYVSLSYRFQCLEATLQVLKGTNSEILQTVKAIEDAYKAEDWDKLDRLALQLPDDRFWIE